TVRAVVNWFWKQFSGAGLSAVGDDRGVQGEWPVHPELLDWLACEFKDGPATSQKSDLSSRFTFHVSHPTHHASRITHHAWDVKRIVKLMVMSSTYRQQSNLRQDLLEIDPNNRLLAYQPPRRLEAEFVRDNALAIAGLL